MLDPAGQSLGPVRGASAGTAPQARSGVEPAHDSTSLPLAAPASIGLLISALSAALISCLLINEWGPCPTPLSGTFAHRFDSAFADLLEGERRGFARSQAGGIDGKGGSPSQGLRGHGEAAVMIHLRPQQILRAFRWSPRPQRVPAGGGRPFALRESELAHGEHGEGCGSSGLSGARPGAERLPCPGLDSPLPTPKYFCTMESRIKK